MRWDNISQAIVSAVSGLIIVAAVLLPAIIINILGKYYARLESKSFERKFGSVTEGINVSEFYSANYYAVFLLMFAATLVCLYGYPFVQCLIIFVLNVAVSDSCNPSDDDIHRC